MLADEGGPVPEDTDPTERMTSKPRSHAQSTAALPVAEWCDVALGGDS